MRIRNKRHKEQIKAWYRNNRKYCIEKSKLANQAKWDKLFGWQSGTTARLLSTTKVCMLCGKPFEGRGRGWLAPVIDHNHETNTFRGVIHNRCNRYIGSFGDNAEYCLQMATYLSKS
jgi:hypothetical protein